MSTKRARLLRVDNYRILHYFNLYCSNESIKNNKLQSNNTYRIKILNKVIKDNKSLLYSSVYEHDKLLSNKLKKKELLSSYPLYMKPFLVETSNINYNNNYTIYNLQTIYENKYHIYNSIFESETLFSHRKFYLYKKQGSYFNNIYKHFIRHKYEKEDQNKLSYRKLNLNLLQKIL